MRRDPERPLPVHTLEALSRLAEIAARTSALSDVFRESLDCLERTLGADRSAVLLFDPDGVMRFKASRSLSESYCRKVEGHSPWSREEKDPIPLLVPAVASQANFEAYRATILSEGIHALAFVPIVSGDSLLGKFMVYFDEPHPFSAEEIQLAQVIAAHIAFGVQRTRAEHERKQAEEALASNEAITRSIIDTALDAVITMDSKGIVTAWNRRSEALFGWSAEEAVGQPLQELVIPERYRAAHRDGLERYRDTGKAAILDRRIEIQGLRRDGTEFPVELTVTAIQAGGSHWFSAFLRDITARKNEEERMRHENKAKDDFLAMLAHELRNPLNPIRSAVHVMNQVGVSEPTLDRARGIIDRQVRHMARLVDDLLDVSRISRGMILIRKERVDLIALVRATFEDHRAGIEENAQTVILDLPEDSIWVSGDPTRLAQIVGNLLQNATKFTEAGGTIRVRARCEPEANQVVLSVRDSGIGIEQHMLERVFETFTQADRTLDHRDGGLGLGLALVKGLVALHGGSVRATSEGRGQGSEFSIRLPLSTAPPPAPEPPVGDQGLGGSCRVLLIEDHVDSGEGVALLLRLGGHVVKIARTGSEGVARAREFRPDVVLCDIGLEGGMDGYAVARTIRADLEFVGTYLVAVTGYGREEDIQHAREAGFDRHLTKPFDPKALETMLRGLAERLPAIRA